MNLRLLFIAEHFPPDMGGVATSAGRTATALTASGASVDVIAWTRSLPAGRVVHQPGSPSVYRLGRFREWDTTLPHTLNLADSLFAQQRYDAIWGHYLTQAGFFAVYLARLRGLPSVVSIRGNDLDRGMFPPGDFARLLWTLQNCTIPTAVTLDLARKATALSDRTDIVHLPNAVDTATFQPAAPSSELRASLGIEENEAVLGFAGELREKKGQTQLIEALQHVRRQRPACLLIIGEVRPSQFATLALTRDRILVTGALPTPADVNAHLQLCDIYLQPSLWDGMPNALLEAMSAARLCLASDAGGIPEVLPSRAILPRWELHRLGPAILDALDAPPALRAQQQQAARTRIVEHFSLEQEPPRLQALLARLIPSSS